MPSRLRRHALLAPVLIAVILLPAWPAPSIAAVTAPQGTAPVGDSIVPTVPEDGTVACPGLQIPSVDFPVLAAPRISREGFVSLLDHYRSPAAGEAHAIYDQFVAHGVDPAVALAIFAKESSYGKAGRAVRNLSWGNLRSGSRPPAIGVDGGAFSIYPSWTAGALGTARLLVRYGENRIRPGRTTDSTLTLPYVWAPASDGNAPTCYGIQLTAWVTAWAERYPPATGSTTEPHPQATPAPPADTVREGVPAGEHVVRRGDSLWSIALQHYGQGSSWPRIQRANEDLVGSNPGFIRAGWRLAIP